MLYATHKQLAQLYRAELSADETKEIEKYLSLILRVKSLQCA